jgi:mono/diheme cytochrome c family protein
MSSFQISVSRATAMLMMAIGIALYSTPAAADAATTYKAKCAMCHGADGKGETAAGKKMGAHDFASPEVQKAPDAELITVTSKGKNKMPSYEKSLKPEEIKDLIGYIRGLSKGK